MVSNQEKGDKLNEIIEKLNTSKNNEEYSVILHKLLIDDCGGKLYKYMPVRDYTIAAILNNTLHFSSPSVFNASFDCKVGIDYRTLIEAIYLEEFDKIDLYLSDFFALRSGRKKLEEIPAERLSVLQKWKNSKRLNDFLDATGGTSMSNEEINDTLFNNFDVVFRDYEPFD